MWDEIIYPFLNISAVAVEVWEGISNLVPHFTTHLITYPSWDLGWSMLVKAARGCNIGVCVGLKDMSKTSCYVNKLYWRHMGLKLLATRLFVQQFAKAIIKENSKAPHYWCFVTGGWLPTANHLISPLLILYVMREILLHNADILGRELGPSEVFPNQRSRWKRASSPLKHV